MIPRPYVVLAAALLALAASGPAGRPAEAAHLERVVVLQRHGVRAPAEAANKLLRAFGRPPVAWPVAPGELSPHGAAGVRLMGAHQRAVYAAAGLLPGAGCPAPDTLFVWADNAYQRTRASGDALAEGLFPGCGLAAHFAPLAAHDPLFELSGTSACPTDPTAAEAAILAEAGGSLETLRPSFAGALDALQALLDPAACRPSRITAACLADERDRLMIRASGVRLEGALADGATMAESLFLSYAENQPGLTAAQVGAVMPLHEIFARILRRPLYTAARAGGPLVRRILAAVEGRPVPGLDPAAQVPAGARLVSFLGHDVNVSNVAALLGVDWELPGEPDKTAPDTALAFEVWRAPDAPPFVRLRLYYQTLDQLRTLAPLDAAPGGNRIDLTIPGCADGPDGTCGVERLAALLDAKLDMACQASTARPEAGHGQ